MEAINIIIAMEEIHFKFNSTAMSDKSQTMFRIKKSKFCLENMYTIGYLCNESNLMHKAVLSAMLQIISFTC